MAKWLFGSTSMAISPLRGSSPAGRSLRASRAGAPSFQLGIGRPAFFIAHQVKMPHQLGSASMRVFLPFSSVFSMVVILSITCSLTTGPPKAVEKYSRSRSQPMRLPSAPLFFALTLPISPRARRIASTISGRTS
ncbi:hypothetical protein D3C81_1460770 [compost metagenome]